MMKRFLFPLRRALALLLCLLLPLAMNGCGPEEPEDVTEPEITTEPPPEVPEGSVAVPYLPEDSLNPFRIETVINAPLVSLYCRGLYRLDTGFTPVNDLAQSEIVSTGNVKVNLKQGLVFSDGSPLTAQDVVYSYGLAKESVLYREHLNNMESCAAPDDMTVLFTLDHPDVNVLNGLLFPVVKEGTADTKDALPVSCGPYQFTQDGIRLSLTCNTHSGEDLPPVGTVRLTEVTENTVLESLVDSGDVNFCCSDLSRGSAKRTYSSATDIYLNNLVFIGMNRKNVNLGAADLRRALSLALDRQEIVSAGFQSFARAAALPFNTSWKAVADSAVAAGISFNADNAAADALLNAYGAGTGGEPCYLTLLCPEDNSFLRNTAGVIVRQLAKNNIDVTVETVDRYDYRERLATEDFDCYLGEIKLSPTMDLSPFFSYDGAAIYGIDPEEGELGERYEAYRGGELPLDDFLTSFVAETPFIPLCFRNGRMCYTSDITAVSGVSEFSVFGQIAGWQVDTEHAHG